VDLERLAIGVAGAMVGVIGWLFVGLYIQRRDHHLRAQAAARAVYFELELNAVNVDVAREHGQFGPLTRATFDRLLPEVATWLAPAELRSLVTAYQGHAGYDQAARDGSLRTLSGPGPAFSRPSRTRITTRCGRWRSAPSGSAHRKTELARRDRRCRSAHLTGESEGSHVAETSPREVINRFAEAMNRGDWDSAVACVHPDFVDDPQSGERIRGRDNVRAILSNYPGGFKAGTAGRGSPRIVGGEDRWLIDQLHRLAGDRHVGRATRSSRRPTTLTAPTGTSWRLPSSRIR
jgi:ketosteroid isomerase-like protein